MRVKVRFYSLHREIVGKGEIEFEAREDMRIKDLLELLKRRYPELKKLKSITLISLNHNFAKSTDKLKDRDEVALFPPVGGG
jgi:molybdopterin synthase catalytic subunit